MMKALVVYNGFSGKSKILKNIDYICRKLKTKYEIVETFASTAPNSIRDYVLQNAMNYDLLLAAGGDGSINEAVNGLMMVSKKPTLAYVPTGTCNDTGKNLGLKKSLRKTMKIILDENKAFLDVNKINGRYFVYGLAAGNLTDVSYVAKYQLKKKFGRIAYYLVAAKSFCKDKSINIEIITDDKVYNDKYYMFLATNTRYLASFKIHHKGRVRLNDGTLSVTLIKKTHRIFNVFDFLFFLLFGERYKHNIIHFTTKSMVINSREAIRYNTDGESLPKLSRIEVTVIPEQIEMIISKRVLKKHFN